jgi:hypothetical protein
MTEKSEPTPATPREKDAEPPLVGVNAIVNHFTVGNGRTTSPDRR